MDSITQIALGATVGLVVGWRKYGGKTAIIGAICGTIPDLDVFIPYSDDVSKMVYHRGFSHSILFALLATPLLALVFAKIGWFKVCFKSKTTHLMIFLVLTTHLLLDAITIYGTQLAWPLTLPPAGIGSIFIIDPIYTLILLLGLLLLAIRKNIKNLAVCLALSCAYLGWGFAVQQYITNIASKQLNTESQNILVHSTVANTLLWRVLVVNDNGYKVGYVSILDNNKNIKFKNYYSDKSLLKQLNSNPSIQKLNWFTKGFYSVEDIDGLIVLRDLRMGMEPDGYVFSFAVGKRHLNEIIAIPNYRVKSNRSFNSVSRLMTRIWNENTKL